MFVNKYVRSYSNNTVQSSTTIGRGPSLYLLMAGGLKEKNLFGVLSRELN